MPKNSPAVDPLEIETPIPFEAAAILSYRSEVLARITRLRTVLKGKTPKEELIATIIYTDPLFIVDFHPESECTRLGIQEVARAMLRASLLKCS